MSLISFSGHFSGHLKKGVKYMRSLNNHKLRGGRGGHGSSLSWGFSGFPCEINKLSAIFE